MMEERQTVQETQEAVQTEDDVLPTAEVTPDAAQEETPRGERAVLDRLKLRYGIQKDDWEAVLSEMDRREERIRAHMDQREKIRQALRQRRAGEMAAEFKRQGEALRQLYPEFSFEKAGHDGRFRAMLQAGCTLQQAYEALNPEAYEARMHKEGRQAEPSFRPLEAGAQRGTPIRSRRSLSQLNRAQREEIAKRVLRGERIEG